MEMLIQRNMNVLYSDYGHIYMMRCMMLYIYILHALQVDYSCINRGNSAGFSVTCMIYFYVHKYIEQSLPHTEIYIYIYMDRHN